MFCAKCGKSTPQNSRFCPGCGYKIKSKPNNFLLFGITFLTVLSIGIFSYLGYLLMDSRQQAEQPVVVEPEQVKTIIKEVPHTEQKPEPEKPVTPPKEVSQIIEESLPKVFTITTGFSQGSGFLVNDRGDILTNAHVVEGSTAVTILDNSGQEFTGTVIGYSNEVDISLIRVPAFAGQAPLPLETENESELGDEVIALGSPRGLENTATLGNISGVDRTFVIDPHLYEGIYQTSAPLAPGSSGGPLIDKKTEKAIAINSAQISGEESIGFSIPLFMVIDTINQWSAFPMSKEEIYGLFYNGDGLYYYQDMYDSEGYFDGGSYSEEYDDYYEEFEGYYGGDYNVPDYGEDGNYDEEDSYDWGYDEEYYDDGYDAYIPDRDSLETDRDTGYYEEGEGNLPITEDEPRSEEETDYIDEWTEGDSSYSGEGILDDETDPYSNDDNY